jgi:hypothetical protein
LEGIYRGPPFGHRDGRSASVLRGSATGEALVRSRASGEPPFRLRLAPPRGERRRHLRKYAEGKLSEDKSFYFRGRAGKLNLRAQNLV